MASDDPTKGTGFETTEDESERGRSRKQKQPGEDRPGPTTMRDTTDAQERIAELEHRVDELVASLEDANARIDALHRAREYLIEQVEDIDERVDDLEAADRLEEVTA